MSITPAITVDPALASWKRRLLSAVDRARRLAGAGRVQDRILIAYVAVAGSALGLQMLVPGFPWTWAWFLGGAVAGSALAAAGGRWASRRWRDARVRPGDLSPPARDLLRRAQDAIGGALASPVRRAGHLDRPVSAAVLAAREWELARMLRGLSAATGAGIPDGGRDIIRETMASAVRRVEELEAYAARVDAADAAFLSTDGPGDCLLNLAAMTGADRQASAELAALARDADAAEQSFRPVPWPLRYFPGGRGQDCN